MTALATLALGDRQKAESLFQELVEYRSRRSRDQSRYYQALAARQVGKEKIATEIGKDLVDQGTRRLRTDGDIDFFAEFGEQMAVQSQRPCLGQVPLVADAVTCGAIEIVCWGRRLFGVTGS